MEMSNYKKNILSHPMFYISTFTNNPDAGYIIFIHGGPGYNCGILEYLIEHDKLFELLNYNLVLYDQRGCGRSRNFPNDVSHFENVNDLKEIYEYLTNSQGIKIVGLIGHSYGAKLLFDFYKNFKCNIPGVFVSTANNILTPRLNNLILDLEYLKKTNREDYTDLLSKLDDIESEKIWGLTEKLSPLFHANKDRPFLYWANIDYYQKIQDIQNKINLPINKNIFINVRKDLYSNQINFSVDIESLCTPYLWINGFQDLIMNGSQSVLSKKSNIHTFYRSSHYPHIEENHRFSETINDFIKNC